MSTDDVLDECADDVEATVVAWLAPLRRAAAFRRPGDELPFTLVHKVTGTESVDEGTAEEVVSVHTLCDAGAGAADAATECALTHRRMLLLARQLDAIELPDGRMVGVDYVAVVESPIWQQYSDTILRKVGRYRIGLSYSPADTLGS